MIEKVFVLIFVIAIYTFIFLSAAKAKKKRERLRESLPDEIRKALSSNPPRAYYLYQKYKSIGGKLEEFTPDELFTIYYASRHKDELSEEKFGKDYKRDFCRAFLKKGDYEDAYNFYVKYKLSGGVPENEFTEDEILDIYLGIDSIERLCSDYSEPCLLSMAKRLDERGKSEQALQILKERDWAKLIDYAKESQDYDDIVTICEKAGGLGELMDKIPSESITVFADSLMKKNRDEDALRILTRKPKSEWTFRDYDIRLRLYIKLDIHDLAEDIFNEIQTQKTISDTPQLYYDFATYCEEAGKIRQALDIYRKFITGNVLYKDVIERYRSLKDVVEEKPAMVSPRAGTISGGEEVKAALIAGKYELLREIGRGGMGVVYEAMNQMLKKKVAIKKMKEEIKIRPRDKARFFKEARTVAELNHQNIVDIYDIIDEEGEIYLVFEYVEGKTIENIIDEKGRIEWKETVKIIEKVCDALGYAHSHKKIHRDLKPSNIMLLSEGQIKVMDFGIAREAKDTISRVSGKGDTSGTLVYMAPEQHLGQYDERTDIYNLGVTIYEMLTGEVPFRAADLYEQKKQMVYRLPCEIIPELPKQFDEIIKTCLQADKERRYGSIEEFRNSIVRVK